jgi:hypothetical protein
MISEPDIRKNKTKELDKVWFFVLKKVRTGLVLKLKQNWDPKQVVMKKS